MAIIQYRINTGDFGLEIVIETERTVIRSVIQQDTDLYLALFADPAVIEKYGDGRLRNTPEEQATISKRIQTWVERWASLPNNAKETTYDPYNAMAIFEKSSGNFIGHIVLGRSGQPGVLECAMVCHKNYWQKGFASEVTVSMKELLSVLITAGYKLDGKPVTEVIGTARIDNIASQHLMNRVGMTTDGHPEVKYGHDRYNFKQTVSNETLPCLKSPVNVLGIFNSPSVVGPSQEERYRACILG